MPVLHFQEEKEFVRFLNDTSLLQHGRIQSLIRRGPRGGILDVVTESLPDVDFEKLSMLVSTYGGKIALVEESGTAPTRGVSMDRYIESIQAKPASVRYPLEPAPLNVLLMIEDADKRFENAMDRIFRFGKKARAFVKCVDAGRQRLFLVRLGPVASHYLLLHWEGETGMRLFVPLAENPGCFLERGFTFPLSNLAAYHPQLSPLNLIGRDGRWWKCGDDAFYPMGDISELSFSGRHAPDEVRPVPIRSMDKLEVVLRLEPRTRPAEDGAGGDAERIATLEARLRETEAELERLKRGQTCLPVLYRFENEATGKLLEFVSSHPLRQIRDFSYVPVKTEGTAPDAHFLVPRDLSAPRSLPPEIAACAYLYLPQQDWFETFGAAVFIPHGFDLLPELNFSNQEVLDGALGAATGENLILIDRDDAGAVAVRRIPKKELVPAEDSIRFLNRAIALTGTQSDGHGSQLSSELARIVAAYEESLRSIQQQTVRKWKEQLEEEMTAAMRQLEKTRAGLAGNADRNSASPKGRTGETEALLGSLEKLLSRLSRLREELDSFGRP